MPRAFRRIAAWTAVNQPDDVPQLVRPKLGRDLVDVILTEQVNGRYYRAQAHPQLLPAASRRYQVQLRKHWSWREHILPVGRAHLEWKLESIGHRRTGDGAALRLRPSFTELHPGRLPGVFKSVRTIWGCNNSAAPPLRHLSVDVA